MRIYIGFVAVLVVGCTSFDPNENPSGSVVLVPDNAEFGTVIIGSDSATAELMLVGTGPTPPLTVSVANTDYTIVDSQCNGKELIESQVCTVGVVFNPSVIGASAATLEVLDKTASLAGEGLEPGALTVTPPNADFDEVRFGGETGTVSLTIENMGSALVSAIDVSLTGDAEFSIENSTCTELSPASTCTLDVVFTPTGSGGRLGNLAVMGNGVLQSAVSVSGVGIAPMYELLVTVSRDSPASRVTSSIGQINCPDGVCSAMLDFNQTVTLNAVGPDFQVWTGDCNMQGAVCTLVMDGPKATQGVFFNIDF